MTNQKINQSTLTPKEAFNLGVDLAREKNKKIKQLAEKMEESYQHWLWDYLEIDEV